MTYTLGQIIQAEAGGNTAGGFAVASTIYNRSQSGLFPSDPTAVANQPGQFAGNLTGSSGPGYVPPVSAVTAQNQAYADAIQNGTLSNYGNTGNALYFQSNQGQPSTVVGGNSANIGGNYFSDKMGQPSSGFVAPQYGGATVAGGPDYSTFDGSSPNDAESGNQLGQSLTVNADATGSAGTADFNDLPDNLFDGSTLPQAGTVVGGAAVPGAAAVAGGGGAPINITNLPGADTAITGAGTAVQKGATTAGQDVQQSAGGLIGTFVSAFNNLENYTSYAFVVVALVVMGIIFVAGGLRMFGNRAGISLPSAPSLKL